MRPGRRRPTPVPTLLAFAFLLFHLPYLPASLEDLDSINFALGVRQFDVARHQPHPPGYPLFILAGKASHRLIPDAAKAIAAIGIAAGTLGVLVVLMLFRRFDREGARPGTALAATLVAITAPLYWFTAARPLSDMTGLVAALAVQVLTLRAGDRPGEQGDKSLIFASFCAALAAGLRSQAAWLTLPLLTLVIVRRRGVDRRALAGRCALACAAGGLVWAVPLVVLSGGPAAYWRAVFNQGAEDLTGIQMLWTTPTLGQLLSALYYAFIAPWARWETAAAILTLAVAGALRLRRISREAMIIMAAAFGPYFVFDLLFQETFTTRYALPLVVPVAYLAARGALSAGPRIGTAIVIALAAFDAHAAGTSLAAYSRQKAPAFRLLDDMQAASRDTRGLATLAADRREDLELRRPLLWLGSAGPQFGGQLVAPAQHEWLEVVKYWNQGGQAPVWFVAEPRRAQIDLIDHGVPTKYRWSLPYPTLVGGVRPNEMDWYRLDRPEWYLGEGWSLTPEVAGVAFRDRRGLEHGPIEGWVHGIGGGVAMVIGGRNFEPATTTHVTIARGSSVIRDVTVAPGAFLEAVQLPSEPDEGGAPGYSRITVSASPPARVAIEQFDASKRRPVLGFGAGWHESEYNPGTGLRWRWLSDRAELRFLRPRPSGGVVLRLEGESPRKYFARPSRLVVRMDDRVLLDQTLRADFSVDVTIPAEDLPASRRERVIILETDQTFVPADRSRRTRDRRPLGLRIFSCELRPAS